MGISGHKLAHSFFCFIVFEIELYPDRQSYLKPELLILVFRKLFFGNDTKRPCVIARAIFARPVPVRVGDPFDKPFD
jgi:hypothetical protein